MKAVGFAVAESLQCISRSDFICIQVHLPWARAPIRACPELFQEELSEPIGCRNGMGESSRQGHERQLVLSNVCCPLPAVQLIHLNLQGRKVGPRAILAVAFSRSFDALPVTVHSFTTFPRPLTLTYDRRLNLARSAMRVSALRATGALPKREFSNQQR